MFIFFAGNTGYLRAYVYWQIVRVTEPRARSRIVKWPLRNTGDISINIQSWNGQIYVNSLLKPWAKKPFLRERDIYMMHEIWHMVNRYPMWGKAVNFLSISLNCLSVGTSNLTLISSYLGNFDGLPCGGTDFFRRKFFSSKTPCRKFSWSKIFLVEKSFRRKTFSSKK